MKEDKWKCLREERAEFYPDKTINRIGGIKNDI